MNYICIILISNSDPCLEQAFHQTKIKSCQKQSCIWISCRKELPIGIPFVWRLLLGTVWYWASQNKAYAEFLFPVRIKKLMTSASKDQAPSTCVKN